MQRSMNWLTCLALSLVLFSTGCGSRAPKTTKVSGVVEFDGKPLSKGTITFLPQAVGSDKERNRPATGIIDATGHYSLSTYAPGDGALPGKYLVTVVSYSVEPTLEEMSEKGAKPVSAIPGGYGAATTSGLTANVDAGSAVTLDFKLTTGGAPDQAPEQPRGGQIVDQFGT